MTEIHLVRDYPHAPTEVWAALTEPELMAKWMIAAEPKGFFPIVGTRFEFVGPPRPGWNGVVKCEVTEVKAPELLRYSWLVDDGAPMQVSYRVEPHDGGTRFTFDHTGFVGIGGFLLAKLFITGVRKRMFDDRLPALLAAR